jgi:hypothetical protein
MRKQCHFWPAGARFDAWDVDRLVALSRGLPVRAVAVDSISKVDTGYWFGGSAGNLGLDVAASKMPVWSAMPAR